MVYRKDGDIPQGLATEFSHANKVFLILDEEKTECERIVAEGDFTLAKFLAEEALLSAELLDITPAYESSREEISRLTEDHAHKSMLTGLLRRDHMSLIAAQELAKNPVKSYSSKADEEKREALVNYAKGFDKAIFAPGKVVDHEITIMEQANQSRMRREVSLILYFCLILVNSNLKLNIHIFFVHRVF